MHLQAEGCGVGTDLGQDGVVRRFGDDDDRGGLRVVRESGQRLAGGAATHGVGEVTSADTEAVGDADPGGVEETHDLLGTGAGSGDESDGSGAHDVGEPERDTLHECGPAVRSLTGRRPQAAPSRTSSATDTFENSMIRPASIASNGLTAWPPAPRSGRLPRAGRRPGRRHARPPLNPPGCRL